MLAVFVSGGKQHEAVVGRRIKLEKLDFPVGASITFDKVLLVSEGADVKVGKPNLQVAVEATVLAQGRHDKIRVMKFRRRKHHMKQMGHRQYFTEVEITAIKS